MMPALVAATAPVSRFATSLPSAITRATAMASATYAPVIAAVRVPPSACSTSQSMVKVCSPIPSSRASDRSDRPIRRWISCVRPPMRPVTDSRAERVLVELGSIEYSAVIQPLPLLRRKGGTRSSKLMAHSTRVCPSSIRGSPPGNAGRWG